MTLLERFAQQLADRYRIERELGQGGMAMVMLAEDLKHHRPVAIKLLKPELSAALGPERFLREIEIAAALQHPHILPLFDSGRAAGLLYYVMPFAEGESLRQRIARERQLPVDDALRIIREAGGALQYAHEHGVVHRDVKPENIMLCGGQAVVADFGIARALHAAGAESITRSGIVVGTPQYMSPEQAGGGAIDGRSDQYSLACTLYEMLIGQPPFTGPSVQAVIARHSLDPVPGLRSVRPGVPSHVEAAVLRAMAKVPADRFAYIGDFLAALGSPEATVGGSARPASGRPATALPRHLAAAVAAGLLVAGAGWLGVRGRATARSAPASATVTSIAVLPFEEVAASPDSSYLGAGMTEGLIADLAELSSLKVISRPSVDVTQAGGRSLSRVANELGVAAVVDGSIRRTSDSVHVSVRLLRPDSTTLFTRTYGARLGELPSLQREITAAIAASAGVRLERDQQARLEARSDVDHRAYEAYLRGRFHLERGEMDQAKAVFEQASQLAPDWAPPLVGLANYYTSLPFFTDLAPAEVLPKARAALAQALELDETLAEAHAANAYIRAYYEWDWRAAEREYRRALELRPNYADAYFSYSRFLASRRRLDEAIAQIGRAVDLDPLSLSLQANRALLDYFAGSYGEAEARLRTVLRSDSTDVLALWGLALVAEQQGRPDEAIALLEPISDVSLNRKASLGHAYAVAGRTGEARKVLAELETAAKGKYVPAYYFALVHGALGQRGEALRALERAYEERSTVLAYLRIDPRLTPLREEPRFVALTRRLGGESP